MECERCLSEVCGCICMNWNLIRKMDENCIQLCGSNRFKTNEQISIYFVFASFERWFLLSSIVSYHFARLLYLPLSIIANFSSTMANLFGISISISRHNAFHLVLMRLMVYGNQCYWIISDIHMCIVCNWYLVCLQWLFFCEHSM